MGNPNQGQLSTLGLATLPAPRSAGIKRTVRADEESRDSTRLTGNPRCRFCLDQLSAAERGRLEQDLESAAQAQQQLLPSRHFRFAGWDVSYQYKAMGPVGGDYCDAVFREGGDEELLITFGDACGKGVTASLLMARLHAVLRSLSAAKLSAAALVEAANQVLWQPLACPAFATLVCIRANQEGEVEVCNAGHCPPVLIADTRISEIEPSGPPLGLFRDAQYSLTRLRFTKGWSLFFYTDGLIEARKSQGNEYGCERLRQHLSENHSLSSQRIVEGCLHDLSEFLEGASLSDDLTVMAVRHTG